MSKFTLTADDRPSRPVLINGDHVASVKPRRQVLPSMNTQTPGLAETKFKGAEIVMYDGTRHQVMEDFEVVEALVNEPRIVSSSAKTKQSWDAEQAAKGTGSTEKMTYGDSVKANLTVEIPDEFQVDRNEEFKTVVEQAEDGTVLENGEPVVIEHGPEELHQPPVTDTNEELSPAEKRKRTLEAKKAQEQSDTPENG